MSSILEVSIDSEDFALGRALSVSYDVTVSLEEVIPTGKRAMPYFWVSGEDLAGVEVAIERDPTVERLRRHLKLSDSALYSAKWAEQVESLLTAIADADGTILDGVGTAGTWRFTLRFPDREGLSHFRDRCDGQGISHDVQRIYDASAARASSEYGLTENQRETLVTALQSGYFEVPRDTTQKELAEALDIRSSAASETLRRATAELVANTLVEREMD